MTPSPTMLEAPTNIYFSSLPKIFKSRIALLAAAHIEKTTFAVPLCTDSYVRDAFEFLL